MNILYRVLNSEHLEEAFKLATEVFIKGSTLHVALSVGLEEYREYLREPFNAMVSEEVSVAAIDQEKNTVVGCIIASDFHRHLNTPLSKNEKFAPLGALGNALACQYLEAREITKGQVILSDMAVIAPEMSGKNIYQEMRHFCHENARKKGFEKIVGELSSNATQHVVLNKLGHQKIAEIKFSDFEFQGKKPFASITIPESIILAEGEL